MSYKTISYRTLQRQKARDQKANPNAAHDIGPNPGRPRVRGDCAEVPRPCPYVSCRYNLDIEVNRDGGLRFPDKHGEGKAASCALDEAARGPRTLDEIGEMFGMTRERIRQEERRALENLRAAKILQDSPHGGLVGDTEYTQAPLEDALAAFGLNDSEDIRWLRKVLNQGIMADEML